jgi:hypothetical protein
MKATREKLFRLYINVIPPDGNCYIPDSLGEFSPFIDPRHDSMGRELVTCFLVDAKGHIAIFLNRLPCNYVPYKILFNLDAYNRFMQDYFPEEDNDGIYPEENGGPTTYDDRFYQKVHPVYDYIHGELSLRQANSFSFIEKLFWLIKAFFITRFEKNCELRNSASGTRSNATTRRRRFMCLRPARITPGWFASFPRTACPPQALRSRYPYSPSPFLWIFPQPDASNSAT